jgi:hypothetical protein
LRLCAKAKTYRHALYEFCLKLSLHRLEEKMAQQRGMKRAAKVLVRKQKKRVQTKAANIRRVERLGEVAAKEEAKAEG